MLKSRLLFVALTFIVVYSAQAQLFSFGPKVGLSFPNFQPETITIDDHLSPEKTFSYVGGKTAFVVGFFLLKDFRNVYIEFQPMLLNIRGDWKSGATTAEMKVNGLELPLFFGAKIKLFRIFAGLSVSRSGGGMDGASSGSLWWDGDVNVGYDIGVAADVSRFTFNLRFMKVDGMHLTGSYSHDASDDLGYSQVAFSTGLKLNKK